MGKPLQQIAGSYIGTMCPQLLNKECQCLAGLRAGSILFTLSCSTGLFQMMANHSLRNRLCVAYPYAAGSLLYTWGAFTTMVASADALSQLGKAVHARAQAGILKQPVQLMPAVTPPEASACEPPSASRTMQDALFAEASGRRADLLSDQRKDCCSNVQNRRLSTSPKTSPTASTTLETLKQTLALLVNLRVRIVQRVSDLQLNLCSAHSWATLDLTGMRFTLCTLYATNMPS